MENEREAPSPPQLQSQSMETEVLEVMPRVEGEKDEVEQERREATEEEEESGGSEMEMDSTGTEKETERCIVMPIVWNVSSEEKDRAADSNQLQEFALFELQSLRLADLVTDALWFEEVYKSQKFWFCHFCRSYFSDGDSLIMHLKVEHLPSVAECQSWPSLLDKQDREFVESSTFKMVWKPIDVNRTLRCFYSLCRDARMFEGELWKLPWPWSDDNPERSKLLSQLEQVLKDLASDENGLSFLSSGLLRHLIAVASRHILVQLPGRDLVLDFTRQLASSPLSFCFLEEESLIQFVQVARRMSQIIKNFSALDKCNSTSCNMSSDSSIISYRLSFLLNGKVYFVLGPANCQDQKLSDIPCTGPLQLPSEPPKFLSDFLAQLDLCSDLFCKLIMEESISCLYTVYNHISTWWSYQGLLRSHKVPFKTESSDFKNSLNWLFPVIDLEKERKDYLYQADICGLQFVEELCTLQSLEFEVRRLCTFDFRSYIVPLMQRFLQRWSSLPSKEEKLAAGFGCSDIIGDSFAGQIPSNAFKHVNKEYHPSIFICVHSSALMNDIDSFLEMVGVAREAIYYLKIHKTWRYWYCYLCAKRFLNRESHMKHMEDMHKFNLPRDEQSRLVPRLPSKHEVDQLLGVKRKTLSGSFPGQPNKKYENLLSKNAENLLSKNALLKRVQELLYSVLEDKTVPFLDSHLVSLAEFARDVYFKIVSSSNEKKLADARKIDETTQLDFSMYNTLCLRCVVMFLDNIPKQCTFVEMQTRDTTYFPHVASCGISFAGSYLIFDAAKFAKAFPCAKKELEEREHPFVLNFQSFMKIKEVLLDELDTLKGQFDDKHKVLGELDVVFALDRMFMGESDRVEILDSFYPAAEDNFQHQLISRLRSEASSRSIENAVRVVKDNLLFVLNKLDIEIMQKLARINKLKREMSDLCFWDYSTDILLVIGVFLKPRIRVDGDLAPWASVKLQELLHSIDHLEEYRSFRITSVSIGEVFVNIRDKWGLGFDYKRMRLNFEGECELVRPGDRYIGFVDFVGSSDWLGCKNEDMKVEATVDFTSGKTSNDHEVVLALLLRKAICAKLFQFEEAFIEKNDVCILGHDRMSDCMREKVSEYICLNKWHRQKKKFAEWDSASSSSSSDD